MEHETHHEHKSTLHEHLEGLEGFFDTYLRQKAPIQLPTKAKEFIVQYGPWISLVLLIIGALAIIPLTLLALGLTFVTLPFQAVAGTVHTSLLGFVHIFISIGVLVLEGMAIPGLLKRKLSGWKLVYYSILLSAVGSLLSLSLVSLIINVVIGMYLLFQIREYYK